MAYDNDELKIIPERDDLQPSRSSSNGNSNGLLWGAVIALVAGVGGLYYQNTQLNQSLKLQSSQFNQAINRVQALEDELTATGRDLSKSGATLESRIQTSESEIRKLWDLSNKRNRSDIESNSQAIASIKNQLDTALSDVKNLHSILKDESATRTLMLSTLKTEQELLSTKVEAQQATLTEHVSTQQQLLTQQVATEIKAREALKLELESKLSSLDGQLETLLAQQSNLKTQLANIEAKKAQSPTQDMSKTLQEHQLRLDSIDASRRQLTSNVTRLNTDVSNLQLEVNALIKGSK